MNCAICKMPVTRQQAAIDHIVPLSRGGRNIETNMQTVHIRCHKMNRKWWRRLLRKIGYYRWKLTMWLDRRR